MFTALSRMQNVNVAYPSSNLTRRLVNPSLSQPCLILDVAKSWWFVGLLLLHQMCVNPVLETLPFSRLSLQLSIVNFRLVSVGV